MNRKYRNIVIVLLIFSFLLGFPCMDISASEKQGADILTQQLLLGDDLTMRFHIAVEEKYRDTAVVTAVWADQSTTHNIASITANEDGSYPISVDLAAAQMTEQITLMVSTADAVLTQGTYSIRDYAIALLEGNYTDATKQMVKKMLDYGAKAQAYFAHNLEKPANKNYEIENSVLLPENVEPMAVTGQISGVSFYGASLVFRSKLAVRFYFTAPDGVRHLTFTAGGQTYTSVESNGLHYIEIGEINPQELDKVQNLSVTDGIDVMTVSYSPIHYILRMCKKETTTEQLNLLLQSLYAYHLEAKSFVGIEEDKTISIAEYALTGAWSNDRLSDSGSEEAGRGPSKSYDGNDETLWNPQAQNNYDGAPGIIYTFDGFYDLESVSMKFYKANDMYFDLYGSADGLTYEQIAQVTADNAPSYYTGAVCTVNASAGKAVRYVKIVFTGRNGNGTWVNLYETVITGTEVAGPTVQASVAYSRTEGSWLDDGHPEDSYDNDVSTVWMPLATDYQSGESVVYTLSGTYDLKTLELDFESRQYYFDLYVSSDGIEFIPLLQITKENAARYYCGTVCTLDSLSAYNVRYIKLQFTGCSNLNLDDKVAEETKHMAADTQEKQVGVFYFLWHGAKTAAGPFDVTKIMAKDSNAASSDATWLYAGGGAVGMPHWWGESLFGYYRSTDRWVMEKDVQMLTDADVDFLALDYSNGTAYPTQVLMMLELLDKYDRQGYDVPKLTFITKAESGKMVMELYETFYLGYPQFAHLWYCVDGKPLMVGVQSSETLSEECREYFTWRHPQWPRESYNENAFPWMDFDEDGDGKQTVYTWDNGSTVMSVSVAQHNGTLAFSSSALYGDTTNHTRSYHNGANDTAEDAYLYGYNFAEQFENAIEQDVDMVFVTGWNEWIATRQASGAWNDMNGKPINDPVILVDNCDINNSRDIQPMKGGYGDNYYMQMIAYIRKYKGITESESIKADSDSTISIYRDYESEISDRSNKGYGTLYYTDTTGRNDFVTLKMTCDDQFLYAYANTAQAIAGMGQEHCMTLFLATGSNVNWNGYDYVIGRTAAHDGVVTVEKRNHNGWEVIGTAEYILEGDCLQYLIPLPLLGLQNGTVSLEFKWADNYQGEDNFDSFYLNGDCAPYGRQNYRYSGNTVLNASNCVALREITAWGICQSKEQAETNAQIEKNEIIGNWVNTRIGVPEYSANLSYDGKESTKWNPQARNFSSGEGIIYTLDQTYDVTSLRLLFSAREQYFNVSVSADGVNYTTVAQIHADNASVFYEDYLCTISDLTALNTKYIKLEFTGSSNGLWINFYEITVTGKAI